MITYHTDKISWFKFFLLFTFYVLLLIINQNHEELELNFPYTHYSIRAQYNNGSIFRA